MSEVYILVTIVFLAVAAVRLFISFCSKMRQKKSTENKNLSAVIERDDRQQRSCRDVDVFVIDMDPAENSNVRSYDLMWDEPPPPSYEEAVKLSLFSPSHLHPRSSSFVNIQH